MSKNELGMQQELESTTVSGLADIPCAHLVSLPSAHQDPLQKLPLSKQCPMSQTVQEPVESSSGPGHIKNKMHLFPISGMRI